MQRSERSRNGHVTPQSVFKREPLEPAVHPGHIYIFLIIVLSSIWISILDERWPENGSDINRPFEYFIIKLLMETETGHRSAAVEFIAGLFPLSYTHMWNTAV